MGAEGQGQETAEEIGGGGQGDTEGLGRAQRERLGVRRVEG